MPPFFNDLAEFVKAAPGLVGRRLHVIRFKGIHDTVVVDSESRQLVGKQIVPLLSSKRWNLDL